MITVEELINHLQNYPKGATVLVEFKDNYYEPEIDYFEDLNEVIIS